jgi:Ala-tRNA(Pro) deacylase
MSKSNSRTRASACRFAHASALRWRVAAKPPIKSLMALPLQIIYHRPAYYSSPGLRSTAVAAVFDRINEWLQQAGVPFAVLRHEPVYTSEQAAAIRGTALSSGAKALVVKAGERFVLLVLPADRKLDSRKARDTLGVKALRFATREEVAQMTGLQPGSIPPFGSLFGLPVYCDPTLAANPDINFNAGDHGISVQMAYKDYVRVEQPIAAGLT